ncbi:hypothetical protein FF36_05009 [Frankia torreyi]|uniref:Uncharacterized protein n=1 Tax=Frankia torreyi TaxID=1856 RepID=A0A0D8B9N4_9ACTN|nr:MULTISPECIES: hypothetical protein [Frankia]KJE20654.1 hypothetical protein FF36_05009 [Frankia torreyi]KQC34708.1 hypothetical protein UK82_30600 [Frankia sp. ACN1ag]KQM03536.1 hypothetical protein FF86_10382 [Frankia sp. CpI1-P]
MAGRPLATGDPWPFGRRSGSGGRPLPGGPRPGSGPSASLSLAGLGPLPPAAAGSALGTRRPLSLHASVRHAAVGRAAVGATLGGTGRTVPAGTVVTTVVPVARRLPEWAALRVRGAGTVAAGGGPLIRTRPAAANPPRRLRRHPPRDLPRTADAAARRPASTPATAGTRALTKAGAALTVPAGSVVTGLAGTEGRPGRPAPIEAVAAGRTLPTLRAVISRAVGPRKARTPVRTTAGVAGRPRPPGR